MTFVANSALTAAQLNTFVRDNFNETAPAKATIAGSIFVSDKVNGVLEGQIKSASESTSAFCSVREYGDLDSPANPGPSVTVTTGKQAFVMLSAEMQDNADQTCAMNFDVSGATTLTPQDGSELLHIEGTGFAQRRTSIAWPTLNPGSNTFTARYKSSVGAASISNRHIIVVAL